MDPGEVMAVFWACLIGTSSLQVCVPMVIVLAKGKEAMGALVGMAEGEFALISTEEDEEVEGDGEDDADECGGDEDTPSSPTTPTTKPKSKPSRKTSSSSMPAHPRTLRKITPARCVGELALYNVSFAYPTRPACARWTT